MNTLFLKAFYICYIQCGCLFFHLSSKYFLLQLFKGFFDCGKFSRKNNSQ
uniref:Uncharacterized protein n=1 Tax=Ascaris lumbricoides TaxID=6252 RepID=A0A0M3IGQ9_ASCLU